MLILTRRPNEKLVIPVINATIQVVSLKNGSVRLGIHAPDEVAVFREEVWAQQTDVQQSSPPVTPNLHALNNRLNVNSVGLALLRRQLELGQTSQMVDTLDRLEREMNQLKQMVEPPVEKRIAKRTAHRRALLVEDDANECALLAGFLRLAGLDVVTAGDGSDALDHLSRSGRPDVVVMDMMLPRCDGPTTVRRIRDNPDNSALKIIGMTGSDPNQFGLPVGPRGINRWFTKPINPETLLRELTAELHGSK